MLDLDELLEEIKAQLADLSDVGFACHIGVDCLVVEWSALNFEGGLIIYADGTGKLFSQEQVTEKAILDAYADSDKGSAGTSDETLEKEDLSFRTADEVIIFLREKANETLT